jgi:hypothetical protein
VAGPRPTSAGAHLKYLTDQAWHNAAQTAGERLDSRPVYSPVRRAGNSAHLLRVSQPLCKLAHRLHELIRLDNLKTAGAQFGDILKLQGIALDAPIDHFSKIRSFAGEI